MDSKWMFDFSGSFKPIISALAIFLAASLPAMADDSVNTPAAKPDTKGNAKVKVLQTKPAGTLQSKNKISKPVSVIVPNPPQAKPSQPKQVLLNNQQPAPASTMRFKLNGPLQGGVSVEVPHTPEQVTQYLKKMRGIIREYESLAVSSLIGSDGIKTDSASIGAVQNQTLSMIEQIRSIVPPGELKNKHNELASTLAYVSPYIENPFQAGAGFEALTQLAPVLSRLHNTLERYHSGVRNCIAYYELSPELDPFYGESEETKQRLNNAISQTKNSLMNGPSTGAGDAQSMDSGSISNLLNSLGGGGGAGSLGSLGNGDSLKGLQGLDLNSLVKQLTKGGGLSGGMPGGIPGGGAMPGGMQGGGLPGGMPDGMSGSDTDDDSTPAPEQSQRSSNTLGDVNQIFEQMQNH